MSKLTDAERNRLAEIIWHASRADEGTISATGANIVADAILASDWLAAREARILAALDSASLAEDVAQAITALAADVPWRSQAPREHAETALAYVREHLTGGAA